ncbi:MAG: mannosyltransferase YkcB-related protein, partial [Kineosporiaceae bacterium]
RAPLTDGRRAQVLLWGTWLVVTGLVFSFAQGIIHPYYTVALAPAIGGLVGIGGWMAWRYRARTESRIVLAVVVLLTAVWSYALLDRSPDWLPWLRTVVLLAGLAAAVGLLVPLAGRTVGRQASAGVAGLALVAGLAGPAAYAVDTAATAHAGAIPSAGPAIAGGFGPGRRGFPGGFGQGRQGLGQGGPGFGQGQQGFAGPGFGQGFGPGGGTGGTGGFGGRQGGLGGLLDAGTPDAALVSLLKQDTTSTWVAAAVGANSAAGVQLATGRPVLAIGGFNGSDPYPTLEQFQQLVASGKIHYFVAGGSGQGGFGGFGPGGGSGAASQITSWIESTFSSTTVGGVTVYDLTQSASGATTAAGSGATT